MAIGQVQTSDGKLVGYVPNTNIPLPAGFQYVEGVPDGLELGGTVVLNADETYQTYQAPAASDLSERQQDALLLHTQLRAWSRGLIVTGIGQKASVVNDGHDYIRGAHMACYLRFHNAAINDATFKKWAEEMASGALDTTTPLQFYQKAVARQVNDVKAPDGAFEWATIAANNTTVARVNLADGVAVMGNIPDNVDIGTGGWIYA